MALNQVETRYEGVNMVVSPSPAFRPSPPPQHERWDAHLWNVHSGGFSLVCWVFAAAALLFCCVLAVSCSPLQCVLTRW